MKRLLAFVLISMMVIVAPAAAQTNGWVAWLYDREIGRAIKVDDAGAILVDLILPTTVGYSTYSQNLAVSHNGNYLAYTVYNPNTGASQLLVYHVIEDKIALQFEPGVIFDDTISFSMGNRLYNPLDSAIAYAYSAESRWGIVVFDLMTGVLLFSLTSDDAMVSNLGIDPFFTPVIQRHTDTEIDFTTILSGSGGSVLYDSFEWNLLDGTVTPSTAFPSIFTDAFDASGEIVMATYDERLPNRIAQLPLPYQLNALQVYNTTSRQRITFFASEAWSFGQTNFIEGGKRVLSNAYNFDTDDNLWVIIERDGSLVGYAPIEPAVMDSIRGVANGFLYTSYVVGGSGENENIGLLYVETTLGFSTGRPIWFSDIGQYPKLVWASDKQLPTSLSFMPWRALAAPIANAQALVAPLDIPTPTPFIGGGSVGALTIGGTAVVTTTEGDRLRIRPTPSLGFEPIAFAENGTQVTILDGPRSGDGFIWWRVRLPNGTEGWAVERTSELQTLVPIAP